MFYFHGVRKPDFTRMKKMDYDEYWRKRGFTMRNKLFEREVIFFNWIPEKSKVLDIGCGTSRLLVELKEKKHCTSHAMDVSPLVIEGLEKYSIKGWTGDLEDKNFTLPEHYNYIVLSEVLEHLREPEELLEKLSPQTDYFIVSIPNSAFYRYRLSLLLDGRFFTQWECHPSEHLRFWSHTDFLAWLKALDFEVIESRASNGLDVGPLKLFEHFPNLFGHQICYLIKAKK